jgi:hypothetical protein
LLREKAVTPLRPSLALRLRSGRQSIEKYSFKREKGDLWLEIAFSQ